MAITINVGTQVDSTTSPVNASLPTYASGDLLIAQITTREDNPTPVHGITSSGVSWTQIDSTRFLDLGTNGISQSLWYRWATSSEATPSVTCPTPLNLGVTIYAFRGVDPTTPLDGVTPLGGTNAAATTLQPNGATGITTASANAWVLSFVSTSDDNTLNLSVANGFTTRLSGTAGNISTNGSQGLATIEKATAGAQTSCTWNQSANGSDAWAWHLVVLRPYLPPVFSQTNYRWYDNYGAYTESTGPVLANENTSVALNVSNYGNSSTENALRIGIECATTSGDTTDDFTLQYKVNSGSWTNVPTNGSADPVMATGSGSITDGSATTQRLTSGTGTFIAGKATKTNAVIEDLQVPAGRFTELLFPLQWRAWASGTTLATGDTVTFRVLRNGSVLESYSGNVPTATITMTPADFRQWAYRFYDDGSESGSTALAAQNAAVSLNVTGGNALAHLRIGVTNEAATQGDAFAEWKLQYAKNGGAWTDVTTTSSVVKAFNSANVVGGNPTTQRLTGATQSFTTTGISETGSVTQLGCEAAATNPRSTELLFPVTFVAADLTNGDAVTFRLLRAGATTYITYTQTPTANIVVDQNTAFPGVIAKTGSALTPTISTTGNGLAQLIARTASNYGAAGIASVAVSLSALSKTGSALTPTAAGNAVPQTRLLPNGDGTMTGVTKTGAGSYYTEIDEHGSGTSTSDYITNSTDTSSAFFLLENVPADFGAPQRVFIEFTLGEI